MMKIWYDPIIVSILVQFIIQVNGANEIDNGNLTEATESDSLPKPETPKTPETPFKGDFILMENFSLNKNRSNRSNASKPIRNTLKVFYKNYKSTYLGNRTLADYRRSIEKHRRPDLSSLNWKNKKIKGKMNPKKGEEWYKLGPSMNLSIDLEKDLIQVKLNVNSLLKVLDHENWSEENSEKGRGKKYEMVTQVLPLFVIPFLIQSSVMPFLVMKLNLLLMNAIIVGKLAMLLVLITTLRNQRNTMPLYEVATHQQHWPDEPHRRYQAAAPPPYTSHRMDSEK